ncbi:MFS transporter [Brevundimonas sp.]|uniref:MFS transporter n=1 Tax=Brevundimonas sp. TaxID=1871086 RepID=UPI003BA91639
MSPRSPTFIILFLVGLTSATGNMALQSVLPAIGRDFGLPDTLVAAAFAVSALLWMVSSPFWARLSDRLGRKRVILIGLGGFVTSMACFGVATTAGIEGWLPVGVAFALMTVARSIYGGFGSAAPIASQAYLADRTSVSGRTQAMAMLASAMGLGTVVGPALAPFFVLPVVGLAGPLYAFTLVGGVVWWMVLKRLPSGDATRIPTLAPAPATRAKRAGKSLWKDPRVRDHLLFGILLASAQAANMTVLGFHIIDEMAATGMPSRMAQPFIGVAMLAGAAATLMAQWGLIPLLKLGPRDLMRWGAALALAGNMLSMVAPGYFGVVIGYTVMSMGLGFARPGFTAGSSLAVKPNEQGAIAGLMMSLAGFSFLAPPIIGVALYQMGESVPFVMNAALLVAALVLCFVSPVLRLDIGGKRARQAEAATPPASQPGP